MKVKDVIAALSGLDPELHCSLEILPTEMPDCSRHEGASGMPFKVERVEAGGSVVSVLFSEIPASAEPWPPR